MFKTMTLKLLDALNIRADPRVQQDAIIRLPWETDRGFLKACRRWERHHSKAAAAL